MRVRPRRGFTLIEVMLAIAVSATVVLIAHQLLAIVADTGSRAAAAANAANATANRERLLRELLAGVEAGNDTAQRFDGQPNVVRFASWCRVPAGWLEACSVRLELVGVGDGVALEASGFGTRVRLATHAGPASFVYLKTAADGGQWLPRWGNAVSAPLALQVVWGDTSLFLRIGERG